jgi:hypothetical protein
MSDSEWKDFPPHIEAEPLYVIAKSDSIEHLYWCLVDEHERRDDGYWGALRYAALCLRSDVDANREPEGGFWMPLERAQELES